MQYYDFYLSESEVNTILKALEDSTETFKAAALKDIDKFTEDGAGRYTDERVLIEKINNVLKGKKQDETIR